MGDLFTVSHLGAALITLGFGEVAVLVWLGDSKPWNIIALGFLAVLSGLVIANLTDMKDLAVTLGGGNVHIQRQVEHVDAQVYQVERLSKDMISLADRTKETERNVSVVQSQLRDVIRSLITALVFTINTSQRRAVSREVFKNVTEEINKLSDFAYPDPKERVKVMSKISAETLPQSSPTPTPSN